MIGIIYILVAFALGWAAHAVLNRACLKADGVIIVDDTDTEKTKWILDVKTDPDDIPKKKHIHLQVHVQK